jgi:glycosyltransferase involved in cell wall biosynthesis
MPERPLRLLHVCSIKGRGGTGYMASRLCRLLREAGHHVVVGACHGSKMEERARAAGLPLLEGLRLRRGFRALSLANDVARLRRRIREDGIRVVHAWHSIEYWTCALAAAGTGCLLARTRGLVTPVAGHVFNRALHRRTAAVFATCRRIEENYREAGLSTDSVFPLRDGVDTERFRPGRDRSALRGEIGLGEDAPLVVSVGRLEPVKDHATLLRAFGQMREETHLALAGDGSRREALEDQADSLRIADRVHFLGVRSDVEAVLAAADVYALCSTGSEGSSRATLEAMAAGVPVVTTMAGMLPDIVKPGRTGLLFPAGEEGPLRECLENLLGDARLRRRLGEAAQAFVEENHGEDAMLRSVESVYRRILEEAHG